MIERGSWTLSKALVSYADTVSFDATAGDTEVVDIGNVIETGTMPFSSTFKITNTGASTLTLTFKDSTTQETINTIYIDAGKTGVITFPPLRSLAVYANGSTGTLSYQILCAYVSTGGE